MGVQRDAPDQTSAGVKGVDVEGLGADKSVRRHQLDGDFGRLAMGQFELRRIEDCRSSRGRALACRLLFGYPSPSSRLCLLSITDRRACDGRQDHITVGPQHDRPRVTRRVGDGTVKAALGEFRAFTSVLLWPRLL